ncbi:SRPBCC family protein [Thioclava sp. GXIMD4216]|uniref:SRPBCC family protein n=1 Tax=Thioclava litoralis TaxID=3076557 RepID=A0ABZ1DUY4_9RHOB|nr:SRPBCC family protein [Thioclava sp. FTW29]
MKFSTREDISVPVEFVFDELSQFDAMEEAARERGVKLRRTDQLEFPGKGVSWEIEFRLRGKMRKLEAEVTRFERPEVVALSGQSSSFQVETVILLTALSRSRTRLQVGLDIRPRTLGARLMLQSAKLGRSSLDRKFADRVGKQIREIAARYEAPDQD